MVPSWPWGEGEVPLPELPEAETIVRGLAPRLPGRRIVRAEVPRPDLIPGGVPRFSAGVAGALLVGVRRRGKNIVLELEGGAVILVNLGMTGRLLLPDEAGMVATAGHPGVILHLDTGEPLVYDDVRRFGALDFLDRREWRARSRSLGPEPLARGFTARRLAAALARSRSPVRSWLLDQRRLAGVGNIYANEALFLARIHPGRPAAELDPVEVRALHRALRRVLRAAIRSRGTTLRDYRDSSGEEGSFGPRLVVYGRDAEPCLRCGTPIRRFVLSNRSAFHCPRCQPGQPQEADILPPGAGG